MIVDKKGKKYVQKRDVDLLCECPMTNTLNRISELAEMSYMSCDQYVDDDNNKKKLFGTKRPDNDSIDIAKALGIFKDPNHKKAVDLLKKVSGEIEDRYVDLITIGNYHKGEYYDKLLEHYKKLRLEYWRCVALVANYKFATDLTPIFSWL